jgi:hypothetical protein
MLCGSPLEGKKMLHTKGPWGHMAGMPTNVLDAGGLRVARCDFDGNFDHPEAHANARLIAAAPELLEALRQFEKCGTEGGWPGLGLAWENATAAIAKATGATSAPDNANV